MAELTREHADAVKVTDPTRVVHRNLLSPFEQKIRDGQPLAWTTVAEQATFLSAVEAASAGRVSVETVGESVNGNPITLVRVGNPAPTGPPETLTTTVLVVCQMHGNEPAGREAALAMIRDLALMQDADSLAYLEDVTWLFMPSINPDRLGTARFNVNGVDLNHTNLNLSQPETRPIAAVIRDYQPVVVVDSHEDPNIPITEVQFARGQNLQIDSTLRSMGQELLDQARAHTEHFGYTTAIYTTNTSSRILRQVAGFRHAVSLLLETRRPSTNLDNADIRATIQRLTLEALWDYHRANRAALDSARAAAITSKIAEGEASTEPFQITDASQINPPPVGYQLSPSQRANREHNFELWDLEEYTSDGNIIVTMGQKAQPIIPFAFDSRADHNSTAATPLSELPEEDQEPIILDNDPVRITDSYSVHVGPHMIDHDPVKVTDSYEATVTSGEPPAGDTVAPDNSHHGHTATEVTILTLQAVQPDDSWHAQHAEEATVTQEHLVAPDDSWHSQWSDEATLIQANSVAPDDAWHAHHSTDAGVVAGAVVSPDDSWHVHTSDEATIAQAGTVSPDDSWHVQSSTEVTVLGGVAVAPDDSWHGHTSTDAGVTTVHIVSPDDSWHQQWADEVTVSQDVPEPIVIPNVAWQHWGPILLMQDEGGGAPVAVGLSIRFHGAVVLQNVNANAVVLQTTRARSLVL